MSFRLAGITDEFSPDIEVAARAMREAGLQGAELRMIFGKNVVDLADGELGRAIATVRAQGLEIVSIASPVLKCVLPGGPAVEERWQKDMFAAAYGFDDQPRVAGRAFDIAERAGAGIVRVFSYWRTIRPRETFERTVEALLDLAERAGRRGLVIGLENEHACNIATGEEAARALRAARHPSLKIVWDPANALVAGERPFPDGYRKIPQDLIAHVHAKDCRMANSAPEWLRLGEGSVDWKGQMAALAHDGYRGWISLETHWPGPDGDKLQGSILCARSLKRLADGASPD
ncbi:MAG: sugar phosphate isomerase/epimerase family protein [Bryobacteraceae bacterium]|jgi:sugar phosphate isomerase/epimerase